MIIPIFQDYTVVGIVYLSRQVCCFIDSVLLLETYFFVNTVMRGMLSDY